MLKNLLKINGEYSHCEQSVIRNKQSYQGHVYFPAIEKTLEYFIWGIFKKCLKPVGLHPIYCSKFLKIYKYSMVVTATC